LIPKTTWVSDDSEEGYEERDGGEVFISFLHIRRLGRGTPCSKVTFFNHILVIKGITYLGHEGKYFKREYHW
jgi:hypothetical protein